MIHAAKKMKKPHLREHNMDKNVSIITKENRKFTDAWMLNPADLVSSGKISVGTKYASGAHDHDHPMRNAHKNTTTTIESECGKCAPSCNPKRRIKASAICIRIQNNAYCLIVIEKMIKILDSTSLSPNFFGEYEDHGN